VNRRKVLGSQFSNSSCTVGISELWPAKEISPGGCDAQMVLKHQT